MGGPATSSAGPARSGAAGCVRKLGPLPSDPPVADGWVEHGTLMGPRAAPLYVMEACYDPCRRHSGLEPRAPVAFERIHHGSTP